MDTVINELSAKGIQINVTMLSEINYTLHQNHIPSVQGIVLENHTDEDLSNVKLMINAQPSFCEPYELMIDFVPAGKHYEISEVPLQLDAKFLAGMTEKMSGTLRVALYKDEQELSVTNKAVTVLAFDQWHGYGVRPQLLAAFVTPNHPCLAKVLVKAAEYLSEWTGDPSFDNYHSQDADRVVKQAAAIFTALKEEKLIYCAPPASFEETGQRVRLCDAVLQQKLGTCLDLTLLYVSCLEAVGLHPLMILQKGHIFSGVWLDKLNFQESVMDDPAQITTRLAPGVNEIAVVETTMVVNGSNASFDDAMKAAERHFLGTDPIECIIDVKSARGNHIAPIPQRVHDDDGWHIESDLPDDRGSASAPRSIGTTIDVDAIQEGETIPKMQQWERKLLDLGLRNNLINLRFTKTIVPLFATSMDELEDSLSEGQEFSVFPHPDDWTPPEQIGFETMHDLVSVEELVRSEYDNHRLRSVLGAGELKKTMKDLYRNAKTALEENGANTLYLALGLLRWYESPRSKKPRYAPVILLPVEMVRKAANKGYTIRLRDDEPQINVTILEKLKQDFGINIKGLDPLPCDEHGVNIRAVFTVLRKAVMGQERWDVLESAYLGLFSFSQFVMWNDLRNRQDELTNNKIVRSLIDGKLSWDAKPMHVGERVSEDGVLLPMPADASQLYAIEAACNGESFVLHGPPGTGKSQTITSLIVNALAQNKSVLFVAEKKAALEVVQKRLESIGVGPFCLELHSNKAKKRDVLEQLRKTTEITRRQSPQQYAVKADQIREMRESLDYYAKQLHDMLPSGYTLYELINEYEEYIEAPELPLFDRDYVSGLDSQTMEYHTVLLERMVACGKAIGHPQNHPLSPIGVRTYSQQLRFALQETVGAYNAALAAVAPSVQMLGDLLPGGTVSDAEGVKKLASLCEQIVVWKELPSQWAKAENPIAYFTDVKSMITSFKNAERCKVTLLGGWKDSFLELDGEALYAEYTRIASMGLLSRALEENRFVKKLSVHARGKIRIGDAANAVELLKKWQKEEAAAVEWIRTYGNDLGLMYQGERTDWGAVEHAAVVAQLSISNLCAAVESHEARVRCCTDESCMAAADAMLRDYAVFEKAKAACYSLLCIADSACEDWIGAQQAMCDAILENSDDLKEWITFNGIASEAQDIGLSAVVSAYLNGAAHDDILPMYKKAILCTLIMVTIDEKGVLNTFSGAVFNEKIEQYRRMDEQLTLLSREEVFCRLASNLPDFTGAASHSSELGILKKMIKSGGRGTSIRQLVEQLPNLLPRLCPCMLMSPISAAQYLDPKRAPFDIVVFDEASQLPTCKAVGVLARGHNAVIVGDPKQMPPTAFFATSTVDEDNLDIEDLESILDDCLAINMPQTHLLWHYRSRHESLISFSNTRFYDNKLFTFPSVNDRESKVSLVHVDGMFERGKGRRNKAEAEAVVEEIKRRCHDEELSKLSVGVITFNIAQQHLIDDLLSEACAQDPQLERWVYESEEPLFVKNLENVQGDEREVILFSVGYGPDENGKVHMNFGPLNRDGGWRRLNVAVSRARSEMIVFSTLTAEQIDLSKTGAHGVAALKAFLTYAGGAQLAINEHSARQMCAMHNGIAKRIAKLLKDEGFDTEIGVGRSEYRIDVGVIDPDDPERYILGILLDGSGYGDSKTTRDRELAQIGVLRGLGWNVLRIWTMDWWDNRGKEIGRIVSEIRMLQAKKQEAAQVIDVNKADDAADDVCDGVAEETADAADDRQETPMQIRDVCLTDYVVADTGLPVMSAVELASGENDAVLLEAINTAVAAEAPVCRSLLVRRVLESVGLAANDPLASLHLQGLMPTLSLTETAQGEDVIYWRDDQSPEAYYTVRAAKTKELLRAATEVPLVEAMNAVCYVLASQISLPADELPREASRLMGYPRFAGAVTHVFRDAVVLAQLQNLLATDVNGNCVLSESGKIYAEHFSE